MFVTSLPSAAPARRGTVSIVSLGCSRNDVDSEEIAGRLAIDGWQLVQDAAAAEVTVVNTCGFIAHAKQDSIDVLLEAADLKSDPAAATRAVVAVGCMAERYGQELAAQLPEADAVLGFDSYAELSTHLSDVLSGRPPASHMPVDRRTLLPIAPVQRAEVIRGRPASGPPVPRQRLDGRPWSPLKLAGGCDRRCTFCAIPAFRGSFVSRPPQEVLAEALWLAQHGVREVLCVSENTTSYGKDLGDLRLLEQLLPRLAAIDGIDRVRLSYLQPAELRPGLVEAIATTPGVAAYYDLSFQHASPTVLRRMRRFGGPADFLGLLERIRALDPTAGARSNVIVGFPGETEADLAILCDFLAAARLDAVGVFSYSDEEGTAAVDLAGHLDETEIEARRRHVSDLVEELMAQRAEDRIGERLTVLIEEVEDEVGSGTGRAAHQGPDVDGVVTVTRADGPGFDVGDLVVATAVSSQGVDLTAVADTGTPR